MVIKLVWSGQEVQTLSDLVRECLSELNLTDLVTIETTDDPAYKMELGITSNPALCIEESSIDFKDMIFEGIVPEKTELSSMFASILGSDEASGCSTGSSCGSGGCDGCSSAHAH